MPELPEVETVANGVDARVRGERIEEVWLSDKREPMKSPVEEISATLTGKRIAKVHRVGKHIVVDLQADARSEKAMEAAAMEDQWIIHLGMTGRLLVSPAEVPIPPHTHAIARLSSGRELRFVDARRFGRLSVVHLKDGDQSSGFGGPGREPLTIELEEFIGLFRGRKTPIKAALLNQTLLHGVGNIYADEGLFRAGIRPKRQAARVTRAELTRLHEALQLILRNAIKLGGSSVSDYVDADGVKGFFQLEHRVYMRTGEPCLVCGEAIRRIVLAGRGTHYCVKCQR